MSITLANDPRAALVRTKYFSLHPKPLERWLWQQGLPQTAERVFWLHWEEGMRNGDWCSEIPIKRVARECGVDPSTVTRSYQVLKTKGLIRRQDPGRDSANPFQQATAITEVRLPREFLVELGRSPNRAAPRAASPSSPAGIIDPSRAGQKQDRVSIDHSAPISTPAATPAKHRPSRQETQALWGRASEGERHRFYLASRDRADTMAFDVDSRLTASDQEHIIDQLRHSANARPSAAIAPVTQTMTTTPRPRRLSALEIAHARARLLSCSGSSSTPDLLRQVIWAVEEGALSRFTPSLAVNIAIKKVREGAWTKPNRMPPNWSGVGHAAAHPETCGAA